MQRSSRRALLSGLLLLSVLTSMLIAPVAVSAASLDVRFATFNASLNRAAASQALAQLSVPGNAQPIRSTTSPGMGSRSCRARTTAWSGSTCA